MRQCYNAIMKIHYRISSLPHYYSLIRSFKIHSLLMAKLKSKPKRSRPTISTASLPDIIFILLFFFMVVAIIREDNLLVKITPPKATELQKLNRHDEINHIYVGHPVARKAGTAPRIQLNDAFAKTDDIQRFIAANPQKHSTTLHIDEAVTMGIVTDVKTELRRANALKVHYASKKKTEE